MNQTIEDLRAEARADRADALDTLLLESAARTKPQRVKATNRNVMGVNQSHTSRAWSGDGDVD